MPRVKRGTTHVKKRRKLHQAVKGFKWGRKNLIKVAKTARTKAGAHAYIDRRKKKRNARALWQIKIGAFVRAEGLSYSKFIAALKAKNVMLDRKVLAEMAVKYPELLKKIIASLK
ncbi:MAG TPA: 50S ribosomal protein L20 [bacterium]|nr:50S ribosomal protein L20 [bacterium]HPT29423.1 50S ribosomal protein L20 [bacterium]